MTWTRESVTEKIKEISLKGYIPISGGMFRRDDGVVGQVLEREFGIPENNLHIADLGTYELKGLRLKKNGKSSDLTLFHQTSAVGLSPVDIFERFHYIRPSKRDGRMMRKLFTTSRGDRQNNRGFILKVKSVHEVNLYHHDEYLASWDLESGKAKINQILLAFAETQGVVNSKEEMFHYTQAYILSKPKDICEAIRSGAVVMEINIDQPADLSKPPHDRGPHFRISVPRLSALFGSIERIL